MRIAVYGAGGVGGYFGGRLARAGAEVHLIARGAHLRALRERGLRVRSVKGDFEVQAPAAGDPAEVGPCDFVLFCVKTFDTGAAAARLGPLAGAGTAVVPLQNGAGNEEKPARAVGQDHVMGGAAFIFAEIAEPGGNRAHRRAGQHHLPGNSTAAPASGRSACSPAASRPASRRSCRRASKPCCGPSSPSAARRPA